jgi:AcrR family transcriptional regulator
MDPNPTVDLILHAAGELLDDVGLEGLNTTDIARRAGVSTATLYRHFPDKHHIVRDLVVKLRREVSSDSLDIINRLGTDPDWRTLVRAIVVGSFEKRMTTPGGRTSRQVFHLSPGLREWHMEFDHTIARQLAAAIRKRKPRISPSSADTIALTAVTVVVALLDVACIDPKLARKLVDEAVTVCQHYLAAYLD